MRKPESPRSLASIPKSRRVVPAVIACLAATALAAPGQQAARPEFPAGIRLAATARGEAAIAALGQRLPEVAAHYRKTPQQLRALFRSDHSLHADREGRLFYACELGCEHEVAPAAEAEASAQSIGTTDPSPFPTDEAFLLHSRPGANRVIYLDFDGHIDNTPGNWKDGAAAPPFDTNGDPATFTASERERIIFIWQRVAEDFSMFDIDVTTEDPGVPALSKSNSSDQTYGIRVVIGGSSGGAGDWYTSNAGGVAFVGNFDAANDVPCWVFPENLGNNEKSIAEAASHEAGHTLGLNHDGTSTKEYYSGQGNWAPIMGVGYNEQIVQWSKGEYTDANNPEDDLAVMLTQGAVYRPDDHGGSIATATLLTADTVPLLAGGVIERRTDLDFFRITAADGSLNITVSQPPRDSNLRIELKLYDAAGTLLQTATSPDTSAGGTQPVTLTRTVTAGDFFFSVDGIGNGDPLTTGYTDYASLGQYSVSITNFASSWLPTAAATYQWPTPANWSSGSVPGGTGLSVGISNNIAGAQTINLTTATTVGSLFLGDSDSTHAFNIANGGGGSLVFNKLPAAAILSKTTGANDVISAPISLPGELHVNQSATNSLTFSGPISGVGPLAKNGSGTLNLPAANSSFTGIIAVNAGTLSLGNLNALGGATGITLAGGTLATSTDGISISAPITTGTAGTTSTVAFSRNSSATGSLTLGNSISGAGNLTFTTPDVNSGNNLQTIFLDSANSYAGSTLITTGNAGNTIIVRARVANALPATTVLTLDGGAGSGTGRTTSYDLNGFNQTLAGLTNVEQTLRTQRISNTGGGAATLTIQDNGNRTYSGIIGGTNLSLTKAGSGTFTLAGANTHTGGTSITGGLISATHANALGGGAVTFNGGTRLSIATGLNVANNITIGTNTGQSGRGLLEPSGTGTATLSGNITINNNASAGGHFASTTGNDLVLSGVITSSVAVSQRAGTVTYSGGGTGYTSLSSGGTIRVGAANGIATSATVRLGEFSTNGVLDLNGFNQRLAGIAKGANTATIGNSSITTDSVLTTTGTSAFAGVIQDVLGSGNRKVGLTVESGILTLSANNTFTGGVTLNAGQLILTNTGALNSTAGSENSVTFGAGSTGTLSLKGNSVVVRSLTSNATPGTPVVENASPGNATLTIGNSLNLASSFAGVIQNGSGGGTLSLIKAGTGTLTLGGNNTFTGQTTVNAGALRISNAGALGTSAAGTVVNGSGTGSTSNARLELSGNITVTGEAATLSGVGNFYGPLSSFSGVNEWTGNVTLGAAGTRLGASANATLKVSGVIDSGANPHGLVIRSESLTGVVILSAANTYLGDTSIIIGELQLDGGDNRLPVATRLVMGNSGGLSELDLNGRNQEIAGFGTITSPANVSINNSSGNTSTLTVNTAAPSAFSATLKGNLALTKTGADTLTLSGVNTYSGNTTVSDGILTLSASGNATNANTGNDLSTVSIAATAGATLNLAYTGTDQVDKLFIGGVQKAAGVWGSTTSGAPKTDPSITGNGTLTVATGPSESTYASWIDSFFPGVTDQAIIGANADPDNDGIANSVEMVLGGNPKLVMDSALLPTLELVTDPIGSPAIPAGNYLLFSYRRSDLSVAAGVIADFETDTDLVAPWTPATGAPGVVIQVDDNFTFTPPAAADTDRVRVYVPGGANIGLFGRLKVLVP